MSAKRSLHHVPGPREQGAGRLLVTLHRDLALQKRALLVRCRRDFWVPGLESGEKGKLALEIITRKIDA